MTLSINNSLHTDLEKIGRYRIDGIIGSGAMGVVYEGFDTQIHRRVAVKILHHHLRMGELGAELEQRFMQEACAAARCLHSNIVTIFDFGTDKGTPYIVMEYVDGIELKAYLQSNTVIPVQFATAICLQVLEALNQAHRHGVVHRDIKPANIIILANGAVKVSDFGVARLDTSDLTTTGCIVGTPNYMSPEGLLGQTVDARSDLYSVGVVYYELLTRRRPQRELSLEDNLRHLDDSTHLSDQNVRSIKPILHRALQINPPARFQSASEFIAKLNSLDDMDLTEATIVFPSPRIHHNNSAAPVCNVDTSDIHASQWKNDLLDPLERSLAKYIGPVAKLLVRRQSLSGVSREELVAKLASHIPKESERGLFVKEVARTEIVSSDLNAVLATQATSTETPNRMASQTLSNTSWEKLTQLLAYHIGPMAGHIIKKTMKTSLEPNEFIIQIASHIPVQKERQEFIDQALQLFQAR